jgi:hypothetical protein
MNKIYIIILFALLQTLLSAQNRIYVQSTATGANTGSSWTDAYTDLQSALSAAQAGDSVWVAAGTYRPTNSTDRTISFEPRSGVVLLGGFIGTEQNATDRDWTNNTTTLTGDIGVENDSLDNSYNVMYLLYPDSTTVIDGFVVRDGNANFSNPFNPRDRKRCGGGMYIDGQGFEAYATISNIRFVDNSAINGGGLYMNGFGLGSIAPTIKGCIFEYNRSVHDGGGAFRMGSSWIDRKDFINCVFRFNRSGRDGGGLAFFDDERTDVFDVSSCLFYKNISERICAGTFIVSERSTGLKIMQTKNIFEKNNSAAGGVASAITFLSYNDFFIDFFEIDSCVFINNGTITGNANGSVLFCETFLEEVRFSKFTNNIIINNDSLYWDRLIRVQVGKVNYSGNRIELCENSMISLISDSILCSNNYLKNTDCNISLTAKYILFNNFVSENQFQNKLGSVSITSKKYLVNNCTLTGSTFDRPIMRLGYGSAATPNSSIISNICSNVRDTVLFISGSDIEVNCSNFSLHPESRLFVRGASSTFTLDTSNIYFIADPMFVNPDSGDLRLQPCSPLINKGDNTFVTSATDIAGNPRIQRGTVDIGAYEALPAILSAMPVTQPSCPDTALGRVDFVLQNACAPYQYSWIGPNGSSGTSTNLLSPGDYQFSIIDNRGDTVSTAVTIPVSAPPALTPVTMPVICGGTVGGSATFEASGTGPYSFLWAGGSTDSLRTNLPPGTYEVIVRDGVGCATSGTANIATTGSLSIEIGQEPVSCFGGSDGALSVMPANGLAPFSYQWANGSTTSDIADVPAGSYAGTLTDAFGCRIVWILPINEPSALQLSANIVFSTDSLEADGSIALTPSGGAAPYTVLWNTEDALWALGSLSHGVYTATITDANGCTLDTTLIVGVTSGTNDLLNDPRIRAYPNPVIRDQFSVQVPAELGSYDLMVQDALGRQIWQTDYPFNGETVVPVQNWSRGWYLVTVRTKRGQKSIRLLRM